MKLFHSILTLICLFIMLSCAQQGILTGGDKDRQPPYIDSSKLEVPLNGTINFKSERIELNFNEYITLQDPKKQIVITPFLSIQPEIFVKGKKVIIQFQSPLEANTTYIINFGDAIKDITEGNILKNYNYVFSTGSFIDSLKYNAFVYDAFSKRPMADVLVMLYKSTEDSVVKKQKPIYFAKTNAQGQCVIKNIAQATYKVVALGDKNNNYLFDQEDEKIGFRPELVHLSADTSGNQQDTLTVFTNIPSKKLITSTNYNRGKMTFSVNSPLPLSFEQTIDSLRILSIGGEITINSQRDTVSFWLLPEKNTKNDIKVIINDYGILKYKITNSMEVQPLKFNSNAFNNLKPNESLKIVFNEPIDTFDINKMELIGSEKKIPFRVVQKGKLELEIIANWIEDENYEFKALPKAITSQYGNINDTLQFLFEQQGPNKFGSVLFNLEGNRINEHNGDFIVYLQQKNGFLDKRYLSKKEIQQIKYENLTPGKYEFYIIFDSNKNGRWDTGEYFYKQLPEKVEYYLDPIEIRKGWDAELKWIIN